VGNAVFIAKNSIQMDRDTVVVSGDIIVNNSTSGPVLGEAALSLDRGVTTPAGFKLAATSVDLDAGAIAGGDVYYNTLSNQGSITGSRVSPLPLPVFATLPPALVRTPGSADVNVPNGAFKTLDEGAYGNVVIGTGATLRLTGGGYAFRSITVGRAGALRCAAPSDIVVSGRAEVGSDATIGPETGLTGAAIRIQVDGLNGTDGGLLSNPPAIHVGQGTKVSATLYATGGSIVFDQSVEGTGAFLARDIMVARSGRYAVNSAFNHPPVADPQTVTTNGTAPLQITLTGSDPDGGSLTFSIVSNPTGGTLSSPVAASPTSANVTYTAAAANTPDTFTFRVRDQAGATADAIVTINSTGFDTPTPPATTVVANDASATTARDVAATLLLGGNAPSGVALTFSLLPNTGPFHGSLGAVTQGSEVPERSATVVYTPDAGYVGSDSFQFQACGVIAGTNTCDPATVTITVLGPLADPPALAHDVEVSAFGDSSVVISLGDSSITVSGRRIVIKPQAVSLTPATIAGNVADANHDGLGDNANELPGPAPGLMSAGVNLSGGPGSNGTVRMQIEFDMSGVAGSAKSLQAAEVTLPTHRGSIDSLDTSFYWLGVSGDGKLTNSDFEAPAEQIPGAVMPVPESMPQGADGSFSFGVLAQVLEAARGGFSFFAIQGRVNENLPSSARGLEVRTTAEGNVAGNNVPTLTLATPGLTIPLLYTITTLPLHGVLLDSSNVPITEVPFNLPSPLVKFTPTKGFVGQDAFTFDVSNGMTSSSARARITIFNGDCRIDGRFCYDGR